MKIIPGEALVLQLGIVVNILSISIVDVIETFRPWLSPKCRFLSSTRSVLGPLRHHGAAFLPLVRGTVTEFCLSNYH